MDSHILIPKCVLKQFWDETSDHQLHIYNVESKQYYTEHPKDYNAEENHYSIYTENFLSKKIETPLGNAIARLKKFDGAGKVQINNAPIIIKKYMNSLMCRSQGMKDEVCKRVLFRDKYTQQNINDWCAIDGLDDIEHDEFWNMFSACALRCNGDEEFVLTSKGYSEFVLQDQFTFIIPLAPQIAACLYVDKSGDGCRIAHTVNYVKKINLFATKTQLDKGTGEIISSKEENIKNLIEKCSE